MDNYHRDPERIRRVLIPAVKKSNIASGDRESIIQILEAYSFQIIIEILRESDESYSFRGDK